MLFLTFFCLAYSFLYLLLKRQCFFWISVISSMHFDHIDTALLLNELRDRDIMCTTFWSGDIIGTGYFCQRHFDGDIFTATFCSRHFRLEPQTPPPLKLSILELFQTFTFTVYVSR